MQPQSAIRDVRKEAQKKTREWPISRLAPQSLSLTISGPYDGIQNLFVFLSTSMSLFLITFDLKQYLSKGILVTNAPATNWLEHPAYVTQRERCKFYCFSRNP